MTDGQIRLIRGKYVQTRLVDEKWNTYLKVGNQSFCVVERTSKSRAVWFGGQLAKALARMLDNELGNEKPDSPVADG